MARGGLSEEPSFVDLNTIRTNLTNRLESSNNTSIKRRLHSINLISFKVEFSLPEICEILPKLPLDEKILISRKTDNENLKTILFLPVDNIVFLTALYFFRQVIAFNQNLNNWDVSAVTDMTDMLKYITLSTANYDALLLGWSVQRLQNEVVFSAGNSTYSSSSQGARDTLTGTYNWTVTDGGVEP